MDNKSGTSIAGNPAGGTSIAQGGGTAIAGNTAGGTSVAQGGGTAIAGNTAGGTSVAQGGGTAIAGGGSAHVNIPGMPPVLPEYIINGHRFTTVSTPGTASGEGRVFIVENGGNKFALKLYRAGHTPDTAILDAVKAARGGFMVYLHEHGVWTDPTHPGQIHYFELMDYCPYGSLADVRIKTDDQFRIVAAGMAFCIKQCHDSGFIHRDIKPENFLLTVPEIDSKTPSKLQFVVSDFGIGRMMGGRSTITADLGKTGRYASPEACYSSDNVTVEVGNPTDWYSMGLTLLAMCVGVSTFPMVCADRELDTYKRKGSVMDELGAMIRLSDHSKSLLAALLESDPDERAGFDSFKEWYGGKTLAVRSRAAAANAGDVFRIVFNEDANQVAGTPEELAAMMMHDVDYARGFLYRGTLVRALERVGRTRLAGDIDDVVQRIYPGAADQAVGVYAACLCLDPSMTFIDCKGRKCSTPAEIADSLWANNSFYATDLGNKSSRLWAYLAMRGDKTLKTFPDKYRPMMKASGKHGVYALAKALKPSMPFFNTKGEPITSPKDLSSELWKERKFYSSALTDSNHSFWTYLSSLGPNAAALATKHQPHVRVENYDAIYAVCLALDEDMPFYGIDGAACYDVKEIAQELWDHSADYKKQLAAATHPLWTYMKSWHDDGWTKIAGEYPAKIANRPNVWFYEMVYRMDAEKPYIVKFQDDDKWHNINSVAEFKESIYRHGIADASLELICADDFITWLTMRSDPNDARRGPLLEKLVGQLGSNAPGRGWFLIYSIFPELSLTLQTNPKAVDYEATAPQIGNAIVMAINTGKGLGTAAGSRIGFLDSLKPKSFHNSRLDQYLRARKMGSYSDGIAKIIDVDANVAQHKSAPYDRHTAFWKVADYLGADLKYITASGKTITDPRQIDNLSGSERDAEVKRSLPQFCSLWFQEKKNVPFSFKSVTSFYNFLSQYMPTAYNMRNSDSERTQVISDIDERNRAWNSLGRLRTNVMLFCLIPMILTVVWMIIISFTSGAGALAATFTAIGGVAAWILAIGGAIAGFSGGIIGAIIGGLAGYWLTIWIFSLLSAIAPILVAGLVIIAAVFCIMKLNKFTSDKYITDKASYDRIYDQAMTYIVCKGLGTAARTFGNDSIDPTNVFRESRDLARRQKQQATKAAGLMIGLAVVTLVLGLLLAGVFTGGSSNSAEPEPVVTEAVADPVDAVIGSYRGTVGSKSATLELYRNDGPYAIEGKIKVNGKKEQSVQGEFKGDELHLYVVRNGNAIADNCYAGAVSGGVFSGKYRPYTGASSQKFEFSRQ